MTINSRILLSGASIIAAAALIVGGTFAFFSDQGTSNENVFSTGTLDLKLSDETPETDQDTVSASFGSSTLSPGTCTGDQTLTLKNVGTIPANHAEVRLANVVTDANEDASPDMDVFLRINKLEYDTVSVLGQIVNGNGNGFTDLADWAADPNVLDSLALTDLITGHPLVMDVCLDGTADNTLQGDSVTSTFTVDLNQDALQ